MDERLTADPGPVPESFGMDEATIDCLICGGAGRIEIALQVLDDRADWRVVHHAVFCAEHRSKALEGTVDRLFVASRLVVSPL